MRWLLLSCVAVVGCFTEPEASPDACVRGQAGCDCDAGTCDAGLECVASIDKCVPDDCSPGERTCTCARGEVCLAGLECRGGVCLEPQAGTTGNMTTSVPTTSADASGNTIMSGPTSDMTSDPLTGSSDSGHTSDGTTSVMTTDTGFETEAVDCDMCLLTAQSSACMTEFADCMLDDGCDSMRYCIFVDGVDYSSCCPVSDVEGRELWNDYVECAMMRGCVGQCPWLCMP